MVLYLGKKLSHPGYTTDAEARLRPFVSGTLASGRRFESLPESLSFFPLFIFSSLFLTFLSDFDLG